MQRDAVWPSSREKAGVLEIFCHFRLLCSLYFQCNTHSLLSLCPMVFLLWNAFIIIHPFSKGCLCFRSKDVIFFKFPGIMLPSVSSLLLWITVVSFSALRRQAYTWLYCFSLVSLAITFKPEYRGIPFSCTSPNTHTFRQSMAFKSNQ